MHCRVIHHYGTLSAGHYTATCASPAAGDGWHAFNDRVVTPVPDAATAVVVPSAYILCFVRRSFAEQWRATIAARAASAGTSAVAVPLDVDSIFPLPSGAMPLDDAPLRTAMAQADAASAAALAAAPLRATPTRAASSAGNSASFANASNPPFVGHDHPSQGGRACQVM